jgi:type II secretory pathway component GspD/PulD (secretin)
MAIAAPPDPAEPCNLEMQNADVAAVLQLLARQRGINLVFASEVKAKRSFSLQNTSFEEALTRLTKYDGMSWHLDGDVYVVGTPEKLQELFPELRPAPPPPPPAERLVVKSYLCSHIKASEAVSLLDKLFPAEASGGLVASLAPGPLTPGLSGTYSAQSGMGAQPMGTGSAEQSASRRVLVRGPEVLVESALEALRSMDVPRRQVNIAVTIRDVTQDALKELGISWSWSNIGLRERSGDGIQFGAYSRQPFNIDAVLSAMEKEGKAQLLAAPNVSVLDGEKAFVLIGQRLLYPVLIGYSQANTPIFDKQEERVGIYLQVSALITEDDEIALTLYPQVSVVTGYLEQNGGSYPQIATREAQTSLRVKHGQPIVIGGLIRQEEIKTLERVPGLSQIPLFGELFKRRKTTKLNSQVIIIITPTILEDSQE